MKNHELIDRAMPLLKRNMDELPMDAAIRKTMDELLDMAKLDMCNEVEMEHLAVFPEIRSIERVMELEREFGGRRICEMNGTEANMTIPEYVRSHWLD